MYIESYKQLKVWQKSIDLVKEIYKTTNSFPKSEIYGLTSQMRRSAVSIPSNIAEGQRRGGIAEYIRFLNIADASSAELETQIIISKDLYSETDFSKAESLLDEVQKCYSLLLKNLKLKAYSLKLISSEYLNVLI